MRRGRFDRNPVAAVRQRPEPAGRDRIASPVEFRALWDQAEGDRHMRAHNILETGVMWAGSTEREPGPPA